MTEYKSIDSNFKLALKSGSALVDTKVHVSTYDQKKTSVQGTSPSVGSLLGVNGGMSPTAVIPGCDKSFWTCKQAYYITASNKYVKDTGVYLLRITESGTVSFKINLEPVIYSIIKDLLPRGDSTKNLNVASYWVNPLWYLHKKDIEDNYPNPPTGGYNTKPGYCGVLGPVYEGVVNYTDVTSREPWTLYNGPRHAPNIFARDIHTDKFGNLWCLLTIGWETIKPYDNTSINYFNWATLGWPRGYTPYATQEMDVTPYNTRYWYPCNTAVNSYNAGGIPQLRTFLVCFLKSKQYKVWDYVPFIPGTYGRTGSSGIASRKIASPPLKLDVDKYGNVYCCAGVYTVQDYISNRKIYHNGYNAPEFYYFYAKPATEKGYTVSEGLEIGRIEGTRYWSAVAIGGYNCTYTTPAGNFLRSLSTWSLSGNCSAIVKYATDNYNGEERYFHISYGNKSLHRAYFKIDTKLKFPHPVLIVNDDLTVRFDGPTQIRDRAREFRHPSNNTIQAQQLLMDYTCLFAQCDLLESTVFQKDPANNRPINLKNMVAASWFAYTTDWPPIAGLPTRAQINPYQAHYYMVASGTSEGRYVGGTIPDFWYSHYTRRADGTPIEFEARAYTYGISQYQQYPMYTGYDIEKQLISVASMRIDPANIFKVTNPIGVASIVGPDYLIVASTNGVPYGYYNGMKLIVSSYNAQGGLTHYQKCHITSYTTNPMNKITVATFKWQPVPYNNPQSLMFQTYPEHPEQYPHVYEIYIDPFEHNARAAGFPICQTRQYVPHMSIVPMFHLIQEKFVFTTMSWDSMDVYYKRWPTTAGADINGEWPYRWHSMKRYPKTASDDAPPAKKDTIFRYTRRYWDSLAYMESDEFKNADTNGAIRSAIMTALKDIKIKYYGGFTSDGNWYDGLMYDLKWSLFADTVACEDTCGILVRQIEIDLDIHKSGGTIVWSVSYNPWVGHRVYYVTRKLQGERKYTNINTYVNPALGVPDASWYEVTKNWTDPASPLESSTCIYQVSFIDLPTYHLKKVLGWQPSDSEMVIEKMCGFGFDKKWILNAKSPRHYLVASAAAST